MTHRIHPLSGESITNGKSKPREAAGAGLLKISRRRTEASYDAARSGTDLDGHWAFSDGLDPDASHNKETRKRLRDRSRYEAGSNAYYKGIIRTHCNMVVGVGPTLRMLTGNRDFNQLVEREWFKWTQQVKLRRKLWSMCYARTTDGESFGVLQNNPGLAGDIELDLLPIEAEQCQSTGMELADTGRIDGVIYDAFNNIVGYEILPTHPGGNQWILPDDAIQVPAASVVHWFKIERPGAHRGVPECTSSLPIGASGRRHREATVAAAETAADLAAISTTQHSPAGDTEPDPVAPFTGVDLPKRTWLFNPMGWDITQMRSEHPNATYSDFQRHIVSEQARPLSMPYNAAACDSSTYSFASGKLDTLCYRAALDVERQDCNDLVLDHLFAMWFREWTIVAERRDIPPAHQWDWPTHPVIDIVQESKGRRTQIEDCTLSHRQALSDDGRDLEDHYAILAEDWFGEANDENIAKVRKIVLLRTTPQHAIQYVAAIVGVTLPGKQVAKPKAIPASEEDTVIA